MLLFLSFHLFNNLTTNNDIFRIIKHINENSNKYLDDRNLMPIT